MFFDVVYSRSAESFGIVGVVTHDRRGDDLASSALR
jgi:hypothetical protein